MARYECTVCGYIYDEEATGTRWQDMHDSWQCPVCGIDQSYFQILEEGDGAEAAGASGDQAAAATEAAGSSDLRSYLEQWRRTSDQPEQNLNLIEEMAITSQTVLDPMRTQKPVISWDEILIKGAQLATRPLGEEVAVNTSTVIGANAAQPMTIKTPVYISHMSFGALSREAKIALAKGSAAAGTAIASGEGGILTEEMAQAGTYIFEYVPNQYSVTDDNLRAADAIEIKIGQSAKPGMGGHLPGNKVTDEIAEVRGFPPGQDIISPPSFAEINTPEQLRDKVDWLRERSHGRPIGIKLAAGHIEADLEVALFAAPDFITIDGRPGATGAASKVVKDSTSIPTIYALCRARRYLDQCGAEQVSLVITGGLRLASDFAKALALGADAVAIATAAMIACGCQQYRICHSGRCPVGIATQDPRLRQRLSIEHSARRVQNYLTACTNELRDFARLTGKDDVHQLSRDDLCTTSFEIARSTGIEHAGGGWPALT